LAFAAAAFADSDKSRVYISANFSQSFEDFSYNAFVDNFMGGEPEAGSKSLEGPRYDFSAGYRLGSKIRIEGQYIIISEHSFDSDRTKSNIEYKATAVFANLIYDFWDAQESFITPFIGVGAGFASPNLKLSVADLNKEREENGFSWQAQGGLSVKLVKWLLVNVKYSYLSVPEIGEGINAENMSDKSYIESEFKKGVQSVGVGITLLL
jgi:opacity protein-like surface antigen